MQSLFFKAAKLGHKETLKKGLNTENIDVQHDRSGYTLLCFACANNQIDVVKLLLANKAEVNTQTREFGYSALMLAILNGHESVVNLLLTQSQIDLTLMDYKGNNALMLAVTSGQTSMVEKLVHKSDVSHVNSEGNTVFHLSDKPEINDILVKYLPSRSQVV